MEKFQNLNNDNDIEESCLIKEGYFNFFGSKVVIKSNNKRDLEWIKFIFREYLSNKSDQYDVELLLDSLSGETFIDTFLRNRQASNIKIHTKELEGFEEWTTRNSPLPPFLSPPLVGNYILCHGCAVQSQNKELNIIIGPSMSGKTVTLLKFLEMGYKMAADDLLVFQVNNSKLKPYFKPIGLRETTIEVIPSLKEKIKNKMDLQSIRLVSPTNRATRLVHASDIYPNCNCDDNIEYPKRIIFLADDKADSQKEVESISHSQALIRMLESVMDSGVNMNIAASVLLKAIRNANCYVVPMHNSDVIIKLCS